MSGRGRPPTVLFATSDLAPGAGGIAELSRQVVRALLKMHAEQLISLRVNVLNGAAPAAGDELFTADRRPLFRWYAGNRRRFALGAITARSKLQLFDHVGLARLQGLSRLRRGRYLVLIHGVEMWQAARPDYYRSARGAAALIANSAYTARRTRDCCPGLPPIRVCWPGKDAARAGTNETAAGDTHAAPGGLGPHAMLIVGRLDPQQRHKGHDHLLEALPHIVAALPDARLVVVGGGADRERLAAKAGALGVADRVTFTGWVEEAELDRLYRQCALFVMPSEGDGFGLVFLEAMMRGLPCVGLAGSAAGEIFEDGVSGILVDREQPRDMAGRLAALLADGARRRALGQAGQARYRERFTGRHHAERLSAILQEQLGSG